MSILNCQQLSETLLSRIIDKEDYKDIVHELSTFSEDLIFRQLHDDAHKKAFWLNIYNAHIKIQLYNDPNRYRHRKSFFTTPTIHVAGHHLSFEDIEHGILRRSKSPYGLGYLPRCFRHKMEKSWRVDVLDFKIHFALNCGASSCPLVRFYSPHTIETDLLLAQNLFVESSVIVKNGICYISPIFKWFVADFGGDKGIRSILNNSAKPIPPYSKIKYLEYDWTVNI